MNSVPLEHTCIKTGGSTVIGTVQFIMATRIGNISCHDESV